MGEDSWDLVVVWSEELVWWKVRCSGTGCCLPVRSVFGISVVLDYFE
jgi:hypothetical protein